MNKERIQKTIESLLIVQERDRRIARCEKELEDIPLMQRDLNSKASSRSDSLEKTREALKASRASVRKLEVEIESERQRILKLRDQQIQIKSNDEYKALNREIACLEEKIGGMEDKEIELMEQADRIESEVKELERAVADDESRFKSEMHELEQRRSTLESDLAQLKNEREVLARSIDKTWLERYNLVMKNKKDIALAAMDAGGTCEGCHMNLPPQVAHDVRSESCMVSCSFCGRMLYWPG